ncbi:MAG: FAD-dependent oxidoreductase [Proteobacteria bacterium]|nr:MAG: FAD-dependent oxidoreductase [Pseudomonadota bacterium]
MIEGVGGGVAFARRGSLITSHPRDEAIAERLVSRILRKWPDRTKIERRDPDAVAGIEPGLQAPGATWLLKNEGQVDAQAFMAASRRFLEARASVRDECAVRAVRPGELVFADGSRRRFDWVYDCRGLGADSAELPMRGVRGEVLWLSTPEVSLSRPVRVMHPRYRIYVVPRPGDTFLIGATEIESEDLSPVSVRSVMELASATAIVDPAFLEARVIRTDVGLRPATPDNQPYLGSRDGVTTINGLFRHGYLIAPALVEDAIGQSITERSIA